MLMSCFRINKSVHSVHQCNQYTNNRCLSVLPVKLFALITWTEMMFASCYLVNTFMFSGKKPDGIPCQMALEIVHLIALSCLTHSNWAPQRVDQNDSAQRLPLNEVFRTDSSVHVETDSLVLSKSLPSLSGRQNLVTWAEQFFFFFFL